MSKGKKQTLFISYCWKDGNPYADELEGQLSKNFKIIRDKSMMDVNDDMYSFMKSISKAQTGKIYFQ